MNKIKQEHKGQRFLPEILQDSVWGGCQLIQFYKFTKGREVGPYPGMEVRCQANREETSLCFRVQIADYYKFIVDMHG